MDQEDLFGPEPVAGAPLVRLTAESYELHAGDRVALKIENLDARRGTAELLVLDAARAVVWRSPAVAVEDTVVHVPVSGFPDAVLALSGLSLTATIEADGKRFYASNDTAAASTREEAAVRPVRFLSGTAVGVDAGRIQSMALDPASGRLYFSAPDRARIGVLDLRSGEELAAVPVPSGPVSLGFFQGRLGALMADGTELGIFDAGGELALRQRVLLPTLRLQVQTLRTPADSTRPAEVDTLSGTVRPYAQGFAWGCSDPGCTAPVVFAASSLVAGETPSTAASVMRRVAITADVEPLLVPRFQPGLLASDTIASRVRTFATGAGGADSLVADRADRLRCPSLALDANAFDVARGASAVLYVATVAAGCGEGTRILRIDGAGSEHPQVNALALRNLSGEDRVGDVAEIRVSPDARHVLVRGSDRVHLFDADLRLRGSIDVAGVSSVAWVDGGGEAEWFAVASPLGVALYDTSRRTEVARVSVGSSRNGMLLTWRDGADLFVVVGPRDREGLVAARVPFP